MLRILATLVFAVSVDVFLFGGKYSQAAEQMVLSIFQHF
jgi:hypothetical protein